MNIIVVGAGSFGSWSAYKLLKAGFDVTLIDAWGPGNSRSSSGGESRVIRTVYGQDDFYIEMAKESMDDWQGFQNQTGTTVMEFTGSLWLCGEDDSYVQASSKKIRSLGLQLEEFTIQEAADRWPQIHFGDLNKVIYEPDSGFLRARHACSVVVEEFVKQGGTYLNDAVMPPNTSQKVDRLSTCTGKELTADKIVFACGPWLKELFPDVFDSSLQVSKQEVYYFGTPKGSRDFDQGQTPIWLELNEPIYYGIPSIDGRGFKLARDERGPDFDPTHGDRSTSPDLVEAARKYLAKRFPELKNAPLVESRVCQYTNTLDGHFILDQHEPSGILMVGGGSGHGFKMGPAMGRRVVDLLSTGQSVDHFRLSRLTHRQTTQTQFDHS